MLESKKTDKANLGRHRYELFLASVVLILSFVITALEWDTSVSEDDIDTKAMDEFIEDIDFNKLKRDNDMVAAITETDLPPDAKIDNSNVTSSVRRVENMAQKQGASFSTKLVLGDVKSEVPLAKVEDIKPQMLESKESEEETFHVVEQMPEFPGGATAFMKWLTANINYPKFAVDGKIEGKVVVSFLVDTQGNVQKLRLEKADNRALGVEVIKVMGKMPKWNPGRENGKPCTAMIAVPINFDL